MNLNISTVIGTTNAVPKKPYYPAEHVAKVDAYNDALSALHARGRTIIRKREELVKDIFDGKESNPIPRRNQIEVDTIAWGLEVRRHVSLKGNFMQGKVQSITDEQSRVRTALDDRQAVLTKQLKELHLAKESIEKAVLSDKEVVKLRSQQLQLGDDLRSGHLLTVANEAAASRAIEDAVKAAILS